MARTWHHDRKRFHPWMRWPRDLRDGSRGFYYLDFSGPGPKWWRRLGHEKPKRRAAHMKEALLAGTRVLECDAADAGAWPWPHPRKPRGWYW